jgi:hypothetical protein
LNPVNVSLKSGRDVSEMVRRHTVKENKVMRSVLGVVVSLLALCPLTANAEIVDYEFSGYVDSYSVFEYGNTDGFQPPDDLTDIGFTATAIIDTDNFSNGNSDDLYGPWAWKRDTAYSLNVEFSNGLYWNSVMSSTGPGIGIGPDRIYTFIVFAPPYDNSIPSDTNMPLGLSYEVAQLNFYFGSDVIDTDYFYSLAINRHSYRDELMSVLQTLSMDDIDSMTFNMRVSNEHQDYYACDTNLEGECYDQHTGYYSIYSTSISAVPLPASVWLFLAGLGVLGRYVRAR